MAGFNINEFKGILGKRGAARPAHYAVQLMPPTAVKSPTLNDLPFMVDSANLPSIILTLDGIKHKGYGLIEQRPSGATFEDFTISIIADAKGEVLQMLNDWMSLIYNFDGETTADSTYGIPSEKLNYPDEYVGTSEIFLYDIGSNLYKTYTMYSCFPINIGAVELGWGQTDTLMRISVTFTYRSYKTNATNASSTPVSNIVSGNARSVEYIQRITQNPNLTAYAERFIAIG